MKCVDGARHFAKAQTLLVLQQQSLRQLVCCVPVQQSPSADISCFSVAVEGGDSGAVQGACLSAPLPARPPLPRVCVPSLSTDVHCRPAVERFTARVFKLPTAAFFPRHFALLSGLRALLAPNALRPHGHALAATATAHLVERWPARGQARIYLFQFTHHRLRDGNQNPGC